MLRLSFAILVAAFMLTGCGNLERTEESFQGVPNPDGTPGGATFGNRDASYGQGTDAGLRQYSPGEEFSGRSF